MNYSSLNPGAHAESQCDFLCFLPLNQLLSIIFEPIMTSKYLFFHRLISFSHRIFCDVGGIAEILSNILIAQKNTQIVLESPTIL